jgi:hypothetical protein
LTIEYCDKLRALPRKIGKLGALRELTLRGLKELQEMPNLMGLIALGSLRIESCGKLRTLPRGIGKLGALKQLTLGGWYELQEMPPSDLMLRVLPKGIGELVALKQLTLCGLKQAGDVLAIGRALKAWPLPLLYDVNGIRLSTCWRALGLPAAAADWTNVTTLDYFRVQQQKVAAFASGMHSRLGAASGVSWLHEQALVMIANEVLGGWGLVKEWRQELVGEGNEEEEEAEDQGEGSEEEEAEDEGEGSEEEEGAEDEGEGSEEEAEEMGVGMTTTLRSRSGLQVPKRRRPRADQVPSAADDSNGRFADAHVAPVQRARPGTIRRRRRGAQRPQAVD